MFTSYVQTVLRLQPHELEVSFATFQWLDEALIQLIPLVRNAFS